jgi:HD-GYP domain-containing protein (c-di-GMP phosphodiesterase class II)
MERSYKPALSHDVTVERMMESKNTQFDPALLDVFYSIAADFCDLFESNLDEKK